MKFTEALSNTIDWFYWKPFRKLMPKQTFRYLMCGTLNMAVSLAVYALAYHSLLDRRFLDLGFIVISPHVAALGVSIPVTFLVGFWLQSHISFRKAPLRERTQLIRYILSSIGALGLNYICLKFLVEVCNLYATLSQFISTIITAIYSFYVQKYFTFRGADKE